MSCSSTTRSFRQRKNNKIFTVYDARFDGIFKTNIEICDSDIKVFFKALHKEFSIYLNEKFVVVTTDRRVVDDKNFELLEDGATLYLLLHEHQVLPGSTEEDILFVPHFDTLIQSGKFEYYANGNKSLPYVLAELVDNAISATAKNTGERKIEIRLVLDEMPEKSAIIFLDNGCGMTSKQLNDWAVYRLSKFHRKQHFPTGEKQAYECPKVVQRSINSDISYFGVGGKHAVFFIGDTVRMITKTARSPDVHELFLSKNEFMRKQENKDDVYKASILNRKPGDPSNLKNNEQFLHALIEEEAKKESFTAVVMTGIKDEHLLYLKEDFDKWTTELAHIYHYYIHGVHGNDKKCSIASLDNPKKIDIQITMWEHFSNISHVINLKDVQNDIQSLFINATADVFEFSGYVPGNSGKVEGIFRYHPYAYDKETSPDDPNTIDAPDDDEEDFEIEHRIQNQGRGNRNVFECFWNGRLIPYTKLPAFDWCSEPPKGSPVPSECYKRFSGVLFTDDKFQVSTSKLQFMELELKLRSKETIFTAVTKSQQPTKKRSIQKEFQDWLLNCHQTHDKQVKFLGYKETVTRTDQPKKSQSPWATFSAIEWEKKTYAAGQLIKSHKTKCTYYGTIVRFLLYGNYDGDVHATGGQVEIIREPRGLYDVRKIIPISKIDQSATLELIHQAIENDTYKIPENLVITWPEGNAWSENAVFPAGTHCGPILAEIQNKRGEPMSRIQTGGQTSVTQMNVQLEIIYHASSGDEVVFSCTAPFVPQTGFWFPKIETLTKLGHYKMVASAVIAETKSKMHAGQQLPSCQLQFVLKEGIVDSFIVLEGNLTVRVGVPFDIPLLFKDCVGHSTKPPPQTQAIVDCSDFVFSQELPVCNIGETFYIKNVKLIGRLWNYGESQTFELKVTIPGIRNPTRKFKLLLLPGKASSIHVVPLGEVFQIENGNSAIFDVEVHDEGGNITANAKQIISCQVSEHQPVSIDCSNTGAGLLTTKPINLTIVDGKPQKVTFSFKMPGKMDVKPVQVELEVLPSSRVSVMKLYCAGTEKLLLKNNEKIERKAGGTLDHLFFELYDESGKKVQLTDDIVSKIKVNWTGELNQSALITGKLPDVQVSTRLRDERFYQVSYHDQSISFSFVIVPCPAEPAQLRAILPQSTVQLGETLAEPIRLEFLDQFNNVCQNLSPSTVKSLNVRAEGLDSSNIVFKCQVGRKCVTVSGVRFSSGELGPKEIHFSHNSCEGQAVITVTAGLPSQLRLIHGPEMPLHIFNSQGIPSPFVLQLCDEWGNPAPDKRVVVQMCLPPALMVRANVMSQPIDHEGKASFSIMSLNGVSGDHVVEFSCFVNGKIIPHPEVKLTITPDTCTPVKLLVEYDRSVQFLAGNIFPVTLMSDDGSSISKFQPTAFQMLVLSESSPTENYMSLRCTKPLKDDKQGRYYFRDKQIPIEMGRYIIKFTFSTEEYKLESTPITINVEANKPAKLGCSKVLKNPHVFFCTEINKRTLMENTTLSIMDEFGNETGQDLNGKVVVSISTKSQEPHQIPLFENKEESFETDLKAGKIFFARLAIIKESPGFNMVTYEVTFRVRTLPSLKPFVLSFYFFREIRQQYVAELTSRKNELEEKKKHTKALLEDFRCLTNLLAKKIQSGKNKEQRFLMEANERNFKMTGPLPSAEIAKVLVKTKADKSNIERHPRRVCGIQSNFSSTDDVLGMVGHLAFIADDAIARVISWHLRGDMDCIITRTTETAKRVYTMTAGRQQVMALDSIYVPQRTYSVLQNGQSKGCGNPVFATDLLIFPYDKKSCESVFRNLLGDTIVMNDLDSATKYRQAVVASKKPCPTILTREGDRISSKGKFGGSQNRAPPLNQLQVFGAPLPPQYYSLESQIDVLSRYHAFKTDFEKTIAENNERSRSFDLQSKNQFVCDIEKQLNDITRKIDLEITLSRKRTSSEIPENHATCPKRSRNTL